MKKMLIIIACFIFFNNLFAKEINKDNYWASVGIGNSYFGPLLSSSISYSSSNTVYSLEFNCAEEFVGLGSSTGSSDDPGRRMKEICFLYGRDYQLRNFQCSISGGVGYIYGIDRGSLIRERSFEKIKVSTLCLPIEAKFRFGFFNFLGLGGSFWGNINNRKSFIGGSFDISVGLLNYNTQTE